MNKELLETLKKLPTIERLNFIINLEENFADFFIVDKEAEDYQQYLTPEIQNDKNNQKAYAIGVLLNECFDFNSRNIKKIAEELQISIRKTYRLCGIAKLASSNEPWKRPPVSEIIDNLKELTLKEEVFEFVDNVQKIIDSCERAIKKIETDIDKVSENHDGGKEYLLLNLQKTLLQTAVGSKNCEAPKGTPTTLYEVKKKVVALERHNEIEPNIKYHTENLAYVMSSNFNKKMFPYTVKGRITDFVKRVFNPFTSKIENSNLSLSGVAKAVYEFAETKFDFFKESYNKKEEAKEIKEEKWEDIRLSK